MNKMKKTTKKSSKTEKNKQARQDAFLAEYRLCATVTHAAEIALISRRTHYVWIEKDSAYAAAFEEAKVAASDALIKEARRRAVQGVEEPVFYKGELVQTIRKYSDTLLIFLLKGALPEVYRERYEISGGDKPIKVKSDPGREVLTDAKLKELIALGEQLRRAQRDRDSESPQ